jgi:hypothetical protein
MNNILVLQPYWHNSTWVFDDDRFDLQREAFVAGADKVISKLVEKYQIKNPQKGFKLIFSTGKFPDYQIEGFKISEGDGSQGTFYRVEEFKTDAWLCPSLLHYFSLPPLKLYVKAESL